MVLFLIPGVAPKSSALHFPKIIDSSRQITPWEHCCPIFGITGLIYKCPEKQIAFWSNPHSNSASWVPTPSRDSSKHQGSLSMSWHQKDYVCVWGGGTEVVAQSTLVWSFLLLAIFLVLLWFKGKSYISFPPRKGERLNLPWLPCISHWKLSSCLSPLFFLE